MKLRKLISGVMAAAIMLTSVTMPKLSAANISASASTIFDTPNVIKNGENGEVLEKKDDSYEAKFTTTTKGRVLFDYFFSMDTLGIHFYSSTGAEIGWNYSKYSGSYSSYWDEFSWDSSTRIGSGQIWLDLEAGTYYVKLVRKGSTGSGEWKLTASFPQEMKLGAPVGGSNYATFAWTNVPYASKYEIYNVTTDQKTVIDASSGSITKHTVTGLKGSKTYVFRFRAYVHDAIWTGYTKDYKVTTTTAKKPAKPATVKAVAGPGSATVACSSVTGAVTYRLFYTTNNGKSYVKVGDSTTRKWEVSGLNYGTTYKFLVLAYNGLWSSYKNGDYQAAVKPLIGKPAKIKSTPGYQSVTVKCSEVVGAKKYRLFYTVDNGKVYFKVGDNTTRTWKVTKLVNGRTYKFLVLCYDGKNWSKYTEGECYAEATPSYIYG